jgi:TfoX/Sxy family transcriptional regulator of competence genes
MSMGKAIFNEKHKEVIDPMLLSIPGVEAGMMFGYPAYYVNGKMFACLYENGVGLKVPEHLANELIGKEGIDHFVPLSRKVMREWIQITRERSEDYLKDEPIFRSSMEYVSSLASKKR